MLPTSSHHVSSSKGFEGQDVPTSHTQAQSHADMDMNPEAGPEDGELELEGDYSKHMEDIFSDDENEEETVRRRALNARAGLSDSEDDAEESFVYDGRDAEKVGGYRDQLKDVLGDDASPDEGEDDDSEELRIVENSLIQEDEDEPDLSLQDEVHADTSLLTNATWTSDELSPPQALSPSASPTPDILLNRRQFVHPSISRLRSVALSPTPSPGPPHQQHNAFSSPNRAGSPLLPLHASQTSSQASPTFSAFSSGQIRSPDNQQDDEAGISGTGLPPFRWTDLRRLDGYLYVNNPAKLKASLGIEPLGNPTVMATNGLICIGTDAGRVLVFDFQQNLKCICGTDETARGFGPVTALALSHDHTFVGIGYGYGHIQLYDIAKPQIPARTVTPTSLAAVAAGRQEGHLLGSRIVRIDFVAGRHTAVVTANDQGLAFYHSLGKVLFVDANDVLRLLGKYPDEEPVVANKPRVSSSSGAGKANTAANGKGKVSSSVSGSLPPIRPLRKTNAILSMAPLPFGASLHPTDAYHLVAIITPVKLVIVGLKPIPRTWFRTHREAEDHPGSRWKASLAWFPSVGLSDSKSNSSKKDKNSARPQVNGPSSTPMLAYSWGKTLHILQVFESKTTRRMKNKNTNKLEDVVTAKIVLENRANLTMENDILTVQFLNLQQILVLTSTALEIYRTQNLELVERVYFNTLSLVSPLLVLQSGSSSQDFDSFIEVSHSLRVYKGRVFILGYRGLRVGTLLTWADKILHFVQDGDFLKAIDLARTYHTGEAKGNKSGLPEDTGAMQNVVGEKMKELMSASARYAFSEDRFTDSTHITPGNRGVDRTVLFEDLVSTCVKSCIALDDFDFLFEDLFQAYEDSGIRRIYLKELEPFILDDSIHIIPPRITQKLVAMHEEDGQLDSAERIIWHIDPACLDINQAINLCQKHSLYDALIYVYNRCLRDYVSPLIEILNLVRTVQQRRHGVPLNRVSIPGLSDDQIAETVVPNAYKVYPYLSNILSGLTYPSEVPLAFEDATKAQKEIYGLLFYGRSSIWPPGDSGKIVLTADEDGGVEPTYPYARLLLQYDCEAFLNSLDIAFEHGYLNDDTQGVSRQIIVKILLDTIASDPHLSSSDVTLVNIFIARNVPKYPQFIHLPPTALQGILISLASDSDLNSRDDRQLAAEFLLSVYTPHDNNSISQLFQDAGFFRILRSWFKSERRWVPLLGTYLDDTTLLPSDLLAATDEVLKTASSSSNMVLPVEVLSAMLDALPTLLNASISLTAQLVEKWGPESHHRAVELLGDGSEGPQRQYTYLRFLLAPNGEDSDGSSQSTQPVSHLDSALKEQYLRLLCQFDPSDVIENLQYLSPNGLDSSSVTSICEEEHVYHAVVWFLNEKGMPIDALDKAEVYTRSLSDSIVSQMTTQQQQDTDSGLTSDQQQYLDKIRLLAQTGTTLCFQHSTDLENADVPLEDLWFKLLSSQIECVQTISAQISRLSSNPDLLHRSHSDLTDSLRTLIQQTFASLLTISSSKAVSFPRLFKRLVDSTAQARLNAGTPYNEFRSILTGMLELYRSDGELLVIGKKLLERDLFDTIQLLSQERSKGRGIAASTCAACRKPVLQTRGREKGKENEIKGTLYISHSGVIYHEHCSPISHNTL